jgi:translocation and assembly module TamA
LNRRWIAIFACALWAGIARAEVAIEAPGAEQALLANLRAHLALAAEPCDAPSWRVRRLFARVEQDLQPALRAFGYYRAQVEKRLEQGDDCWLASISLDLGERVRVRARTVEVTGEAEADPALAEVLARLPLAEGAPLHHGQYEDIKTRLREFAAAQGYLDFAFTRQELRVYPSAAAAEIEILADSGPRYRLGELRFSELPLHDDFVERLAATRSGEPYQASELVALDRRLSDSGYFRRVEVRPRRDQAEEAAVPVDVTLEAAARHAWRAGVGYATDIGPRLSLGYANRYLNARGHHFDSELRLSPVESGLTADYLIPGRDPQRENFSFGLRLLHEDDDSVESDSVTLFGRQTIRTGSWTQTRFVELLHEQSVVGGVESEQTLLMPGLRVERTQADDLLRTRKGHRLSLELRGAYEGLVSDASLLQLRGHAKAIHRFGEGGRVTARAEFGATLGDSTLDLPASLRFFAGGDNSVRGYAYKSLGPTDADGEPIGGRNLLVGSLEYEHPVAGEDWWLAAFVDAGNAFDRDQAEAEVGYGLGVRWYSPIGRVRLDLAFPENRERDDWRLHFGLGVDL